MPPITTDRKVLLANTIISFDIVILTNNITTRHSQHNITMSLHLFIGDLLRANDVSSARVRIVEDNAQLTRENRVRACQSFGGMGMEDKR